MEPERIVRPYTAADRPAVHRIAADTAFFGEAVEVFLPDRRLFCDAFYAYYTDVEPEHGWVAVDSGEVVGFLTGCADTAAQRRRWARSILPRLVVRLLRGTYRIGGSTRAYGWGLLQAAWRGEFPHIDLSRYPAHLHINLDAAWRGQGFGRRLIERYLDQLRREGVKGVHLDTTDRNVAACRLYEKVGFQLLDARATRIWKRWIDRPVENRSYGLRLD